MGGKVVDFYCQEKVLCIMVPGQCRDRSRARAFPFAAASRRRKRSLCKVEWNSRRQRRRWRRRRASRPEYYSKTNARNKVNYTIATRGGDGRTKRLSWWVGTSERNGQMGSRDLGESKRSSRGRVSKKCMILFAQRKGSREYFIESRNRYSRDLTLSRAGYKISG